MIAVINAGGKGTRLHKYTSLIPKPMIKVNGISLLERQIVFFRNSGIRKIIIIVGYLGDKIIEYFGNGSKFNIKIEYIQETKPLGSAGSLLYLKNKIKGDFILCFADLILNLDIKRMLYFHKKNKSLMTLFVHPNSHPYDSDLLLLNNDLVIGIDSKTNDRSKYFYKNAVNAGFFIISSKALNYFKKPQKINMEHDFIFDMLKTKRIYAYNSSEYVKDAGTIDRLNSVSNDLKKNIPELKKLSNFQKAIFLDRDGTINKYVGHLNKIEQFRLLPNVSNAIKQINNSEYLSIVITNQPVVSRGDLSIEELNNIHNKMETLLGKKGAYLNAIYYCPHYPERGFPGENKKYKIKCNCRKPKIGLLLKAQKRFNIDLKQSWFIGDSLLDIQCGINAGCKTIFLGNKNKKIKADYFCKNLADAINKILN